MTRTDGYTVTITVDVDGELAGSMDEAALLAVQMLNEGLVPDCTVTDHEAAYFNGSTDDPATLTVSFIEAGN